MTDKYTLEEKIARLRELSDYSPEVYEGWLKVAEHYDNLEDFIKTEDTYNDKRRRKHVEAVWYVHTGVAFSKLWKVLK